MYARIMDGNAREFSKLQTRLSQVDSLKGATIVLVVFGHLIEPLISQQGFMKIYVAIYSFHMPLFVFIAGLFAKNTIDARDGENIVKRILLPFLAFHFLYTWYATIMPGAYQYGPLQPYWHLWFLFSLLCWRLMMPILGSPVGLIAALTITLIAGNFPIINVDFGLSRTLYFLPFFILGSIYGRSILLIIARNRHVAWIWLAVAIVATLIWQSYGLHIWNQRGSMSYQAITALTHEPEIGRALLMLIGFLGAVGFCAIVPLSSRLLEYLGRNVFGIYLLHAFIVFPYSAFVAHYITDTAIGAPLLLVFALCISSILAPINYYLELLFDRTYRVVSIVNHYFKPTHRQQG